MEFSWVVSMAPAVPSTDILRLLTRNVTGAIVKTIVIVAYLLYQTTQFRVSRDLLTDLTAGEATVRNFFPRQFTAASRIQNCMYRKIITYQPQPPTPSRICPMGSSTTITLESACGIAICLPPGSLRVLAEFESLSQIHVSY